MALLILFVKGCFSQAVSGGYLSCVKQNTSIKGRRTAHRVVELLFAGFKSEDVERQTPQFADWASCRTFSQNTFQTTISQEKLIMQHLNSLVEATALYRLFDEV